MKDRNGVLAWAAALFVAVLGLERCGGASSPPDETGTLLYVANSGESTLSVIDTVTNSVKTTIPLQAPPRALRLHPFRSSFYIVEPSVQRVIKLLQLDPNAPLSTIALTGRGARDIAFSADASMAFVTQHDSNSVSVLRLAEDRVLTTLSVQQGPGAVAVDFGSNAGRGRVFVVNEQSGSLSVIDLSNLTLSKNIPLGAGSRPRGLAFLQPTFAYVADAASNSVRGVKLDTLELDPNAVIATGPQPNDVVVATISSSGTTRLLVSNGGDNTLLIIDPATPTTRSSVSTGGGPTEIVVNSTGSRAYVANTTGNSVTVIDLETMQVLAIVPVGVAPSSLALF